MIPPAATTIGAAARGRGWTAWGVVLAGLGVCAVPCWLLLEPGANFYYDWHNHQWLVGYFGEYLRTQGGPPGALNVAGAVGMPQPVFYGFLLYPLLGVVSALLGAGLALRVGVALALAAQHFALYAAGRSLGVPRGVSLATAASVAWGVHSLTNLYNRAALAEFFAVAFLNTAVALGVAAVAGEAGPRVRRVCAWGAMIFATLAAGAHPPTALMGAGLLALLLPWAWRKLGRDGRAGSAVRRWGLAAAGLGLVGLGPWLGATWEFRGELGILGKYRDFSYSVDHIDSIGARFSPWPPDLGRTAVRREGETPYVEAPLQFALLLLAAWHLVLLRGPSSRATGEPGGRTPGLAWLAAVGGGWFVFTLLVSLVPALGGALRGLAPYVQFATRFVSQANLGLLLVVLATGGLAARRGAFAARPRATVVVGLLALAAALAAGVVKLTHAARVRERGGEPQYALFGDRTALVTAGKADAAGDYALLKRRPQLTPAAAGRALRVDLPVGVQGDFFGRPGAARITLPAPGWVITNIVAFPWNRVSVDGREVPADRGAAQEHRVALHLSAGEHVIAWQWRPAVWWRGLGLVSRGALVVLLAGAVFLLWRAGQAGAPTAP